MQALEPWLRDQTVGLAAAGVAGVALLICILAGFRSAWVKWRAARLARKAKRFQGQQKLAEETLSSLEAEEVDLKRLVKEMEKAQPKG
ncbi:MAG TPA: hypothetical protein VG942_19245 [Hyphomonadaceae bacterium]|nr:hypothetical protein [Hyphomonadaceae bacterium]